MICSLNPIGTAFQSALSKNNTIDEKTKKRVRSGTLFFVYGFMGPNGADKYADESLCFQVVADIEIASTYGKP